jgi:hypothetical protein
LKLMSHNPALIGKGCRAVAAELMRHGIVADNQFRTLALICLLIGIGPDRRRLKKRENLLHSGAGRDPNALCDLSGQPLNFPLRRRAMVLHDARPIQR